MKKIYFVALLFWISFTAGQSSPCNNAGFENGTSSYWSFESGSSTGHHLPCNNCGTTATCCFNDTVINSSATVYGECINGIDNYGGFSLSSPLGGNYILLLNDNVATGKISTARYSFTASAGTSSFTFTYIAVLQGKNVPADSAPYFSVQAIDVGTNMQVAGCYLYVNNAAGSGSYISNNDTTVLYNAWQTVTFTFSPSYYGHIITIYFFAADGSSGNTFGYAYIDAGCNMQGTGISTLKNDYAPVIYPNPATDKIYIETKEEAIEVHISNLLGKEILVSREKEIDVSGLATGVYLLEAETRVGIYKQKVFVQH